MKSLRYICLGKDRKEAQSLYKSGIKLGTITSKPLMQLLGKYYAQTRVTEYI